MNELNDEIKLTISIMRDDIDDGIYDELKSHLRSLLEMKRCNLQKSLPVGYWIDDTYKKDPPKMVVKLYSCSDDEAKPLTVEELKAGGWWCADSTNKSVKALKSYGFKPGTDMPWMGSYDGRFYLKRGSKSIGLGPMRHYRPELKEIYRIDNEFFWC